VISRVRPPSIYIYETLSSHRRAAREESAAADDEMSPLKLMRELKNGAFLSICDDTQKQHAPQREHYISIKSSKTNRKLNLYAALAVFKRAKF
jgi:hypothetical protein